MCLGLLLRRDGAEQEVRQEDVTCLTTALRVWLPFVAPAEAPVPVSVSAERPVHLQSPLLRLPGERHRSGKPPVYLCEWGLPCGGAGGPLLQLAFPCARLPANTATGHSGKPTSSVALQVFLVLDSDLLPGERDDFILGVSSGASAGLWSCQIYQGLSSEEEEQG